jgi:hypothetical protein
MKILITQVIIFMSLISVLSSCGSSVALAKRDYVDGSTKNYVTKEDTYLKTTPKGAMQYLAPNVYQMDLERADKEKWEVDLKAGLLTATARWNSVQTKKKYNDFILHLEFNVNDNGQKDKKFANNGNSGVYIQKRYELQILNSIHRKKVYTTQDCGAFYKRKLPDQMVCKKAGQWQSYDIAFRAARFDKAGKKIENARVTVYHNHELIHDDYSLPGKTGAGAKESPEPGVIKLQAHANPVKFRNFWVKPVTMR